MQTFYVLLSLFIQLASAQDFGGMGGEPKFCPPYDGKCPRGQEPVQKWPLKLESMGCNGMGGMQFFKPNGGDNPEPQAPCCDLKHACYQTCGSLKTKCDEEFLKCTKDICKTLPADAAAECEKSSGIYDLMVKMDQSCSKFDAEQYSHCQCVSKGDVEQKRERVLTNFYKKFNPDSVHKVPALAKKADSIRKMATLLGKLISKFPESIKQVKDPQQVEMENMMKDARNKAEPEQDDAEASDADDLGTDEL